jgi:hypothetical protein
MTSYIRKYYLHHKVKKAGFTLSLEQCHKTIRVLPSMAAEAKKNKYISELQLNHNYGVQIINPMTYENNQAG